MLLFKISKRTKGYGWLWHGRRLMNQWNSNHIRSTFLEFFRQRDHIYVPSSSVIPKKNDGSYFVNAGMNQFKPIFLGTVDPRSEMARYRRVVNSQKCIRIGGKHNDLDDVGRDTYHHTFFEMLGNWSFADYFKEDACKMAWLLLTEIYKLPASQLFVTYFGGDSKLGLEPDLECREIWMQLGVASDRIIPFGMKDNFWSMGETGPCGPCTEIHFSRLSSIDGPSKSMHLVNSGSPDVIELWNLVFMQFERKADGSLQKLPDCHIDTGMGFERLVAVLQGKPSNYDTDLFLDLFTAVNKAAKCGPYRGGVAEGDVIDAAYRIVADHARMFTVAISDGLMPGRIESEAKLRQIMYQCMHQASHILKAEPGLVGQLVPIVIDSLSDAFPDLQDNVTETIEIVNQTEQRYIEVTSSGRAILQKALIKYGAHVKCLSGEQLWQIQEGRFGKAISADIIRILASELGIDADMVGYDSIVKKHNEIKVSDSTMVNTQLLERELNILRDHRIEFSDDSIKYHVHEWTGSGYQFATIQAQVVALLADDGLMNHVESSSSSYGIVFNRTSFYAPSGGQISDSGVITSDKGVKATVHGVHKVQQYVVHTVTLHEGTISIGDTVNLAIDQEVREGCMFNHTATHILNYALNQVLGNTRQCGSVVSSNRLTYDFTCLKASVSDEDLKKVVSLANEIINRSLPVYRATIPFDVAKNIPGIIYLPDEVYPLETHVISIGVPIEHLSAIAGTQAEAVLIPKCHPVELCAGTHVINSAHLKALVVTNLQGSQQGTKRISAVSGIAAIDAIKNGCVLRNQLRNVASGADKMSPGDLQALLRSIEQSASGGLLLSKADRSEIRHEVEKLKKSCGVSEQKNRSVRSDLTELIKSLLQSSDGQATVINELEFSKTRDVLDALVHLSPPCPLLLLSSSKTVRDSVLGVAYVPKVYSSFTAESWITHVCSVVHGSHSGPRGKYKRYSDTMQVFSIPGSAQKQIARVAEHFISNQCGNLQCKVINPLNCSKEIY